MQITWKSLREDLKFTGQISEYNYNNHPSARLIINSAKIASALQKRYNITPNKSLSLKPPKRLCGDKALAWIKGYIDGDGSIMEYRGKYKINIIGTEQVLRWIQQCLSEAIVDNIDNKIAARGNVFCGK